MKLKRFLLTILFVFGLGVGFLGLSSGEVWAQEKPKPKEVVNSQCESGKTGSRGESSECIRTSNCEKVGKQSAPLSCTNSDWSCCVITKFDKYVASKSTIKEVDDLVEGVKNARTEGMVNKMDGSYTEGDNSSSYLLVRILGNKELNIIGAIPNTGKAIATIMSNPAGSGYTYVADLMHNAKFLGASPAYAQVGGLGFSSLEPILEAWKQFRNIAYMFFIIITVVIGFMIMMRQKIGGQAAVTAQQAIPNIVIALIAVTFSYAVAGFLIDFMYLTMYLLVGLFPAQVGISDVNKNIMQLGAEIFTFDSLKNSYRAVETLTQNAVGGIEGDILAFGTGLMFAVVIAFAFLFALFSLFFELLRTYIAIIISILLSPLLLMMGALPGRTDVFRGWIRGLVGNLMAFPVVLLLLIIHKLLTQGSSTNGGFLPPYLIGRGSPGAISTLVGLAIILISKDLVVQAKKAISGGKAGIFEQFGSALSSAVSKGWTGGQLVPGLGFTDTSKLPGVGKYVGSGKAASSLITGGAVGIGAGIPLGAARGAWMEGPRKGILPGAWSGFKYGVRKTNDITGGPLASKKDKKGDGDKSNKGSAGSKPHRI